MNGEIEVNGVVLSSMPIGEYDKRLVILTDKLGKIHAFARGARKINSKLLAGTEVLTFSKFKLFSGKNAYNLSDAVIIDFFTELKADFTKLCYGYYLLEFSSYFTKENMEALEILRLIYAAMKTLSEEDEGDCDFIRAVYEWKFFVLEGLMPDISSENIGGIRIPENLKEALTFIARSKISSLFRLKLVNKEREAFIKLCDSYHKIQIDKPFHSLDMIFQR